jgi:hypothetical protein
MLASSSGIVLMLVVVAHNKVLPIFGHRLTQLGGNLERLVQFPGAHALDGRGNGRDRNGAGSNRGGSQQPEESCSSDPTFWPAIGSSRSHTGVGVVAARRRHRHRPEAMNRRRQEERAALQ